MKRRPPDYGLEFLLAFDGRRHWYDGGYYAKFEIARVALTKERPHGIRYSFTLHDPTGERLLGFDNAHGVPARGARHKARPIATDHWHRTETDPGRPYAFKDAETLVDDFFREIERILKERGISVAVIEDDSEGASHEDPEP